MEPEKYPPEKWPPESKPVQEPVVVGRTRGRSCGHQIQRTVVRGRKNMARLAEFVPWLCPDTWCPRFKTHREANTTIEKVQKGLKDYLETKRCAALGWGDVGSSPAPGTGLPGRKWNETKPVAAVAMSECLFGKFHGRVPACQNQGHRHAPASTIGNSLHGTWLFNLMSGLYLLCFFLGGHLPWVLQLTSLPSNSMEFFLRPLMSFRQPIGGVAWGFDPWFV